MFLVVLALAVITTASVRPCYAQVNPTSADVTSANPTSTSPTSTNTGHRSLLLCCGLVGDDTHREKMTAAVKAIQSSAESVFSVSPDRQIVLVADERMQQDLQDVASVKDVCTSESVKAQVERLSSSLTEEDSVLIVLIGHAYLNGSDSQFCVTDRDFAQTDFTKWTKSLKCREQVFILTQPLSGFWVRPLRKLGRVVIAATEADLEFTGTEMPYALADILSGESQHSELSDIDGDGQVSLLDLYLATNLEIDGRFTAIERFVTEHAQLDDNGDGRGSELQTPYLPIKESDDEADDAGSEEKADDEAADENDPDGNEPAGDEPADGEPNSGTEQGTDSAEPKPKQSTESEPADPQTPPAATTTNASKPKPSIIRVKSLDGYRSRFIKLNSASPSKTTDTTIERPQ